LPTAKGTPCVASETHPGERCTVKGPGGRTPVVEPEGQGLEGTEVRPQQRHPEQRESRCDACHEAPDTTTGEGERGDRGEAEGGAQDRARQDDPGERQGEADAGGEPPLPPAGGLDQQRQRGGEQRRQMAGNRERCEGTPGREPGRGGRAQGFGQLGECRPSLFETGRDLPDRPPPERGQPEGEHRRPPDGRTLTGGDPHQGRDGGSQRTGRDHPSRVAPREPGSGQRQGQQQGSRGAAPGIVGSSPRPGGQDEQHGGENERRRRGGLGRPPRRPDSDREQRQLGSHDVEGNREKGRRGAP